MFFIEEVDRVAVKGEGFLDDRHYLPEYLLKVQELTDSAVVERVDIPELLFKQVADRSFPGL